MHLETFLYMLLQSEKALPPPNVPKPDFGDMALNASFNAVANEWFEVPGQAVSVGLNDPDLNAVPAESYGWDNEKPPRVVQVAPFLAKARPITNGDYAAYLEANHINEIPASWLADAPVTNGHGVTNGREPNGGACYWSTSPTLGFLEKYSVRTVFGPVPLQKARDWPVSASFDELHGYAGWMDCRLPTFEEVQSIYSHSENLKQAEPCNGVLSDGNR